MSMQNGKHSRRRFGSKQTDRQDLDVDLRVRAAEDRARTAEARIGDLQAELASHGEALRSLRDDLEAMTERVVSRVAPQVVELEARHARTEAVRDEVDTMRAELTAEREQLVAWRRELDRTVSSLQVDLSAAQHAIEEMPERIREALTPAARAMQIVGSGMAALTGMSAPASALREAHQPAGPDAQVPPAGVGAPDEAPSDVPEAEALDGYEIFGPSERDVETYPWESGFDRVT